MHAHIRNFMTLLSEWAQSAKNMEHFFKLSGPHGSELLTLKGLRFEDEDDY